MSARAQADGTPENAKPATSKRVTNSTRLTTRDLITIGVYSALYAVVMIIGGIPAFSPVLTYALPVTVALFCGPVYLLLIAKVPKRGAIAILGAGMGLVLFVTGMFWLWTLACVVLGVVAGEIAAVGKFRSTALNTLSYIMFSLAPLAAYTVIWINQASYFDYLVGKGTDPKYMDTMLAFASPWMLVAITAGTVLAAWISTLLGRRLLARHFRRAGIVA